MVPSAVFLVHLLQDVHVLRPLIYMGARDFAFEVKLLVSDTFRARDTSGVWLQEIETICAETGATVHFFADDWQAYAHLTGHGLLFAASESQIPNHAIAHDIFRHAPATFLKVTLQHGFECVGFRHGADHDRAYGNTASFGADILCAWYGREQLTALAPSQAPKLVVTGPTSVLQMAAGPLSLGSRPGLICENLHSVRFESAEKLEEEFLNTFRKFAGAMHRQGHNVRLRPHPGGQYSAKADAALPRNVQLENAPLYRLDLRQFCYGISPPSSVLIDMLLADIPTAVWRDRRGRIDVGNYAGLATVSSADELIGFAQEALRDGDRIVRKQRRWLENQGMPLEPRDVYARFAQLFETAERMEVRRPGSRAEEERVLVVVDRDDQLQPEMREALAALAANGEVVTKTLPVQRPASTIQREDRDHLTGTSLQDALDGYDPSAIFLLSQDVSVYGPVLQWAEAQQSTVIYFPDCGAATAVEGAGSGHEFEEVAAIGELLHGVDVVYAPTEEQKARLERAFPDFRSIAVPASQQVSDQREPVAASWKDLLRIIRLGHASRMSRRHQAQKEVQVCHSR